MSTFFDRPRFRRRYLDQEANLLNILPDQLKLQVRRSQAGDTWLFQQWSDQVGGFNVFLFSPLLGEDIQFD